MKLEMIPNREQRTRFFHTSFSFFSCGCSGFWRAPIPVIVCFLMLSACGDSKKSGKCIPGSFEGCDGTELVLCSVDGESTVRIECGEAGCNTFEQRCNECDPSQPFECVESRAVECSAVGEIISEEHCPWGCTSDENKAICHDCRPSEVGCHDNMMVTCDDFGKIVEEHTCEYGCNSERGECNECLVGEISCLGDTLIACDGTGRISESKECPEGCSEEHLECLCIPGTQFCEGDILMSCGEDGLGEPLQSCNYGCNPDHDQCNECDSDTIVCTGDTLIECGSDGLITKEIDCGLGCNDMVQPNRCYLFIPTNLESSDLTEGVADFEPVTDVLINTSIRKIIDNMGYYNVSNRTIEGGNPDEGQYYPEIWVLRFRNLTIPSNVKVSVYGDRALAIVASENITIHGYIDASAQGNLPGPGGRVPQDPGELPSDGANGPGSGCGITSPGAGGGGYGGGGGAGGWLTNYGAGGAGGVSMSDELMSPIWGGFPGGEPYDGYSGNAAGAGGGAIILAAGSNIEITGTGVFGNPSGRIDVSGGGGEHFRAGGGSGGSILIEAPRVSINGRLAAVGGGGACAGYENASGDDGSAPGSLPGAGCSDTFMTNGGNGGGVNGPFGENGSDGTCAHNLGGGGGGGGAGKVRINVAPYTDSLQIAWWASIRAVDSYGYLAVE